jgi:hypothetical protein
MNRIEPTIQDVLEWDVVNWSRALPFWLQHSQIDLPHSSALDLGGRDGGLSLWLSYQCKDVIYSDINSPTKKCLDLHKKYRVPNIRYKVIDATNPIKVKDIRLITSKSVLGAINNSLRSAMIKSIYDALPQGGEYWFVENLKGSIIHQKLRKSFVSWGKRWHYFEIDEIKEQLSKFNNLEFKTFGCLGTFGRNNPQRNFLGTIDKLFFDKLVPPESHYIIAGVARK